MATTIPSGLGTTLGFIKEAAVGTYLAPTRWPQFDKETLSLKKTVAQSQGLHQGLYEQGKRRAYVAFTADGQIDMDVVDRQLGLILAQCIGSAQTATSVSSGVWIQKHWPADTAGLSMTIQKAVPETSGPGTIQTFSYAGCKITDWTLAVQRDQLAKLSLTVDAWNEDTSQSLAAPSFVAANVLSFNEGAVTTTQAGGSVQTAASVTSITGSAAPTALISAITIKGANALDTKRYTIGNQKKAEQFSNNFRKITGTLDMEFANLTDYYNTFSNAGVESTYAIDFKLTGPVIGGALHSYLEVIMPAVYFDAVPVVTEGPGVYNVKTTFTVLDDGVNNPIEFDYQSLDVAV